jgi:hypothetical protein
VVQGLELEVLITELLADREQLIAPDFGLVVLTVARRIHELVATDPPAESSAFVEVGEAIWKGSEGLDLNQSPSQCP